MILSILTVVLNQAQYQKFVALVGRQPDYFEGHAVVSDNFVKGLEIVGERHHLNLLRFAAGPDSPSVLFKGKVLHVFMESMGKNYNPYETLKRAALAQYNDGYAMMVCHPGYLDDYHITTFKPDSSPTQKSQC